MLKGSFVLKGNTPQIDDALKQGKYGIKNATCAGKKYG